VREPGAGLRDDCGMPSTPTSVTKRPADPAHPIRAALTGLALSSLLLPAAAVTPNDLQRCRALADDRARLACYDALAVASAPPAVASPAPAMPATPTPPVPSAAGALATAPPAPAASPRPASGEADFGRASGSVSQVESRIAGVFEGWDRQTRLRLANGQVWQVIDGSQAALALRDPVVRVRRAAMGSFLMEFEGTNRTVRVRRVD
jgi:hypothetical protein